MPYTDRFIATDYLLSHLSTVVPGLSDPALQASYAGFLSVSAVTVFELAVKDIFIDFATKKHQSFGKYAGSNFSQINGRIKLPHLSDYVKSFGDKYSIKFKKNLDDKEVEVLRTARANIRSSYSNLIICRHTYVHQGNPTLTFSEIQTNFGYGKLVIECLFNAMKR